jgi:uncharacterized protein
VNKVDNSVHRLAWMDLISTDIERSLAYYGNLFGWTAERLPIDHGEDYRIVKSGNVIVAGAEQVAAERNLLPVWTVMVEADDARALIDAAVCAGAVESFVLAPMLELGRIAMLRDPWGATLGVWEPGTFRPSDSPLSSGSLIGATLTCPDPPGARDYHHGVFGWQICSDDADLDAGLPVYVEQGDGPACWTPILHGSRVSALDPDEGESRAADKNGLRQLIDPMGARFFVGE